MDTTAISDFVWFRAMMLPWLIRTGWVLLLVLGGAAAVGSWLMGNRAAAWPILGLIAGVRVVGELSIILFGIHEELRAAHALLRTQHEAQQTQIQQQAYLIQLWTRPAQTAEPAPVGE